MKAALLTSERVEGPPPAVDVPASPSRLADYVALTKPRIAVLVLFTVGAGALLAGGLDVSWAVILHAVVGTALVASGACALNQWMERDQDALMRRTRNRPLPAARLSSLEVLTFGSLLGVGGTAYLWLTLSSPLAAIIAAVTFVLYVWVYTPAKRYTTLNTLIGAVPGALPPVIGWCAATGEISLGAVALFAIVFVWQIPHFLAIAWMYRDEYRRAGMLMASVVDPDGGRTGVQMLLYCVAMLPVCLAPVALGSAGLVYATGAVVLVLCFLEKSYRFYVTRSDAAARGVLRTSLLVLPGLLLVLLFDHALYSYLAGS